MALGASLKVSATLATSLLVMVFNTLSLAQLADPTDAISRELSLFVGGGPTGPLRLDTVSREFSVVTQNGDLGGNVLAVDAVTREFSVLAGDPGGTIPITDSISREFSVVTQNGDPGGNVLAVDAIAREFSVFGDIVDPSAAPVTDAVSREFSVLVGDPGGIIPITDSISREFSVHVPEPSDESPTPTATAPLGGTVSPSETPTVDPNATETPATPTPGEPGAPTPTGSLPPSPTATADSSDLTGLWRVEIIVTPTGDQDVCVFTIVQTGFAVEQNGPCAGWAISVALSGTIDPLTGVLSSSGSSGVCSVLRTTSVAQSPDAFSGDFVCDSAAPPVPGTFTAQRCGGEVLCDLFATPTPTPLATNTPLPTATPDGEGPVLSNAAFNGSSLTAGLSIAASGALSVVAGDSSGVSRVEFFILRDGVGDLLGTDSRTGPQYTAWWDVVAGSDGPATVVIRAYDTFNNESEVSVPVNVALAAPVAPVILTPPSGMQTNSEAIDVSGAATAGTSVSVFRGGGEATEATATTADGSFHLLVPLFEGENILTARAEHRGGVSAPSNAVTVVRDSSIPAAPGSLTAAGRPEGEILLRWTNQEQNRVVRFDVFRSEAPFDGISAAIRVNSAPVVGTAFTDLPPADGTYFYRVVAVNELSTASAPSNLASAMADSEPPVASITYEPLGAFDAATETFGQGAIRVEVQVSEPLVASPFLSMTPSGGIPSSVALALLDETRYGGLFLVNEGTPSGPLYAVFSARDRVGNRGTEVIAGASINIDTDGPSVIALVVEPAHPIENDAASPTMVDVWFTLNEPPGSGTEPSFDFVLSGNPTTQLPLTDLSGSPDGLSWTTSFALPSTAGQAGAEILHFVFEAADMLGNVGTTVAASNAFQVYQGDLPPADVPTGLTAKALSGGRIALSWNPVEEASAYQLYRRSPLEPVSDPLAPFGAPVVDTSFEDMTSVDGEHLYAVASIRRFNSQEALSAASAPVSALADATPPGPPQNLGLALVPQGIRATWEPPAGGIIEHGVVTYSLYRADEAPGVDIDPVGRTPVRSGIETLSAVDTAPSQNEHAYVVTAVDEAGNESSPSNTVYLNFDLLPVQNLAVVLSEGSAPLVTWSHPSPSVAAYRVTLEHEPEPVVLAEPTEPAYSDTGYGGGERTYAVVAIDGNGAESMAREIILPIVQANLATPVGIKRGVFNLLQYSVENGSELMLDNVRLLVEIKEHLHLSDAFSIPGGGTVQVPVVVAGYPDLTANENLATTILWEPNSGESVEITRTRILPVSDEVLTIEVETDHMTRGATGKARFVLRNGSGVATEIVMARQTGGGASNEIRFVLADVDGNVFSVKPIQQALGNGVTTLPNGTTVARVAAGGTFTSDWFDIPVPATVPRVGFLRLEIDKFHSGLGTPQHVEIPGNGTQREVVFVEAPYSGEITGIEPEVSYGDEDVLIAGRAVDLASGEALPFETLDLALRVDGFEHVRRVVTDDEGSFLSRFTPGPADAGLYRVSAVFPGTLDRPVQGQFTVGRLLVSPSLFNLRLPRNYEFEVSTRLAAAPGLSFSNVRLEYLATDQAGAAVVPGVIVSLPPAVDLQPGESAQVRVSFAADQSAPSSGVVRLRVAADGFPKPLFFDISFQLSSASPSVVFEPPLLETGVDQDGTINEDVFVENRGLAPLVDAELSLLTAGDETPAPQWIYIAGPRAISRLEVGERQQIDIIASPDTSVTVGYHEFVLRVAVAGEAPRDLPILVAVTQNGAGNMLLHVADIYTATLDSNGDPIRGLIGARVKIQHEDLPSITREATSDALGEVLFEDLPPGRYLLRASAPNHYDDVQYITVRAGITVTEALFLVNAVVSVEWSVREITIEDRYDIILDVIFETNVPIPVLVLEPAGIQLPTLTKGQVFHGELTLTNHGLIDAIDVQTRLPTSDGKVRFDFFVELPQVIRPRERIVIPYRITALVDIDPASAANASGGDACGHFVSGDVQARAICVNGAIVTVYSNSTYWVQTRHCSTPNREGAPGGGFIPPGGTAVVRPGPVSLPDVQCAPGRDCRPSGGSPDQ